MTDTPAGLPEGCKLLALDEVDGTNAEAMRRVLGGRARPAVDHRGAADGRARPLGPRLDLASGQPLRQLRDDG